MGQPLGLVTLGWIRLQNKLDDGEFGVVYKASMNIGSIDNWKPIALKVLASHSRWLEEGCLQAALQHPNIVSCLDIFQDNVELEESDQGKNKNEGKDKQHTVLAGCLALEFCDGGSMLDCTLASPLPLPAVFDVVRQLSMGLNYLYEQNIYHGDIRQENILCCLRPSGTRDVVKLGDFGTAGRFRCVCDAHGVITGYCSDKMPCGTLAYSPPERFKYDDQIPQDTKMVIEDDEEETASADSSKTRDVGSSTMYSFGPSIDAWGLGCLLFELVANEYMPGGTEKVVGRLAHMCMDKGATRENCMKAFGQCMQPFLARFTSNLVTCEVPDKDRDILRVILLSLMSPYDTERKLPKEILEELDQLPRIQSYQFKVPKLAQRHL